MDNKIILNERSEEFDAVKESWYIEAREMTVEKLPDFIQRLTTEYRHDYGTICHAMSAIAVASAWAVDKTEQGGITGFQAGAVMWQFIHNWYMDDNKTGLRLIDYDHLLFPQYGDSFNKEIDTHTWEKVQEQAKLKLKKDSGNASQNVIDHWKSITDGVIPFGFSVKYN